MKAKDVVSLYNLLQENGIEVWLDGGWGIDALLGEQTRPHPDLDIAIKHNDVDKLRSLLEERGYKETKQYRARPNNFVLRDEKGLEIDVHVADIDNKGNELGEKKEMYPEGSLEGEGEINEKKVNCITPEWLIKFHSGYELKEKDFQDVSALCKKFGIDLPEEFNSFKK